MDLFAINISANMMILITLMLRRLAKHKTPHIVFALLWLVIGIRLVLSFSLSIFR